MLFARLLKTLRNSRSLAILSSCSFVCFSRSSIAFTSDRDTMSFVPSIFANICCIRSILLTVKQKKGMTLDDTSISYLISATLFFLEDRHLFVDETSLVGVLDLLLDDGFARLVAVFDSTGI